MTLHILIRANAKILKCGIHNLTALVCFGCILSCSPKISTFTTLPNRICQDESVTVDWKMSRKGTLTSSPAISSLGKVKKKGRLSFTLDTTTTFHLRINEDVFANNEVKVLDVNKEEMRTFSSELLGTDSLKGQLDLPVENWDPSVRISEIRSHFESQIPRPFNLEHDGVKAILPADGNPSDAFDGHRFSGTWKVRAAILPGEEVGNPANPPPDRLRIVISITCDNSFDP